MTSFIDKNGLEQSLKKMKLYEYEMVEANDNLQKILNEINHELDLNNQKNLIELAEDFNFNQKMIVKIFDNNYDIILQTIQKYQEQSEQVSQTFKNLY